MSENTEKDLQDAEVRENEEELTAEAREAEAAEEAAAETSAEGTEEAEFSLEDYMRQYKELEAEKAKLTEEKEQLDAMTQRVTDCVAKRTGVPAENIYIRYLPTDAWGWNGGNF